MNRSPSCRYIAEILFCRNVTPVNFHVPCPSSAPLPWLFDSSPPVIWNDPLRVGNPSSASPFILRIILLDIIAWNEADRALIEIPTGPPARRLSRRAKLIVDEIETSGDTGQAGSPEIVALA